MKTTLTLALVLAAVTTSMAQQLPSSATPSSATPSSATPQNGKPPSGVEIPTGVPLPPDYVIGPDDVLTVVFWREKELSSDVSVRPDGQITLPLLNDVQAAGLTPEQLRDVLTKSAAKFVADPTVTVVVKAINSRKVFITGQISKPGPYPLTGPTSVMQLIAMAGGVHEFADAKNIRIIRVVNGRQVAIRFNYKDVKKGKGLNQNIDLKPGDTIIVP